MAPQSENRAMIMLQTVIALLLGVFISSVWGLPDKISIIQSQIARIETQLSVAMADRYTGSEAAKDLEVQDGINTNINQRLDIHSGILTRQQAAIDQAGDK